MPTDLDSICYKQNRLSEVIARIDLVSPIPELEDELPKEISKAALEYFPIDEPKTAIRREVVMSATKLSAQQQGFTQWNFHGRNREKLLRIEPQSFFVVHKIYEEFEKLQAEFLTISQAIFESFEQAQPSRLGLRYINLIKDGNEDPLDWDEYISEELLGLLDYKVRGADPIRIWNKLEFAYQDFVVRFQFGINNPDHPARIRRREFVLDFDAYFKGLIEQQDVADCLDKYHTEIQNLFERSITNKLREKMNASPK